MIIKKQRIKASRIIPLYPSTLLARLVKERPFRIKVREDQSCRIKVKKTE